MRVPAGETEKGWGDTDVEIQDKDRKILLPPVTCYYVSCYFTVWTREAPHVLQRHKLLSCFTMKDNDLGKAGKLFLKMWEELKLYASLIRYIMPIQAPTRYLVPGFIFFYYFLHSNHFYDMRLFKKSKSTPFPMVLVCRMQKEISLQQQVHTHTALCCTSVLEEV